MKLLLDTHTFIWWNEGDARLPSRIAQQIRDPGNSVHLSLASVWEMQIKIHIGRLQLRGFLPDVLQQEESANNLRLLPILREDIFKLSDLPNHHRDPFDRLITAQGLRGGYQIVTHDPLIAQYGVSVIW